MTIVMLAFKLDFIANEKQFAIRKRGNVYKRDD